MNFHFLKYIHFDQPIQSTDEIKRLFVNTSAMVNIGSMSGEMRRLRRNQIL